LVDSGFRPPAEKRFIFGQKNLENPGTSPGVRERERGLERERGRVREREGGLERERVREREGGLERERVREREG